MTLLFKLWNVILKSEHSEEERLRKLQMSLKKKVTNA